MGARTCGTCAAWRTNDEDEYRTRDVKRNGWCHMHPPTHDGHPRTWESNGCMQHTPIAGPAPAPCGLPWLDADTAPHRIDSDCLVWIGRDWNITQRRGGRWLGGTINDAVTHYMHITPPRPA